MRFLTLLYPLQSQEEYDLRIMGIAFKFSFGGKSYFSPFASDTDLVWSCSMPRNLSFLE